MKSRRVVVQLELETDEKIATLRDKIFWADLLMIDTGVVENGSVVQVQANVIQSPKPSKKAKAK